MNKKVINITKRKLKLVNIVLEPLKPVVLKSYELTNLVQKTIESYENLGFVKTFDVEEEPLLYTQLPEYKEEQIQKQIEEQKIEEVVEETVEEVKEEPKQQTKKQRKNTKKQEVKEETVEEVKEEVKEEVNKDE